MNTQYFCHQILILFSMILKISQNKYKLSLGLLTLALISCAPLTVAHRKKIDKEITIKDLEGTFKTITQYGEFEFTIKSLGSDTLIFDNFQHDKVSNIDTLVGKMTKRYFVYNHSQIIHQVKWFFHYEKEIIRRKIGITNENKLLMLSTKEEYPFMFIFPVSEYDPKSNKSITGPIIYEKLYERVLME